MELGLEAVLHKVRAGVNIMTTPTIVVHLEADHIITPTDITPLETAIIEAQHTIVIIDLMLILLIIAINTTKEATSQLEAIIIRAESIRTVVLVEVLLHDEQKQAVLEGQLIII